MELTSDLTDTADVDAKLARGRSTFKSLSKVFCSTALPIKLRVKLFQTLIVSTVLHGCACWTLSHTVCHKLNVFQSRCLRTTLGVRWQDHVYQMIQSAHDVKSPRHWLNLYASEGWAGLDMFCVTMTSLSTMFCFTSRLQRTWTTWNSGGRPGW